MIGFLRSLAGGLAVWLLALPAQAGIADDISIPVFKELRFSRDSIALVLSHGVYKIGRKPGIAEPIDQQTLTTEFAQSNSTKTEVSRTQAGIDRWVLPDGTAFESQPGYCDEGAEDALQFSKSGHPLETFLDKCDRVSSLAVIKRQLWLGSVSPGEWGDGPGSGVRVLSLNNGRLLSRLLPKKDLVDGFVQLLQVDPISNDMWIATRTALHRIHQFKVVERWYVSEQFSANGNATYEFSSKPRRNSPWAIWARVTASTEPATTVWKHLQHQPKLLDRLHFAYDEEGYFFSIDGLKLEPTYQPGGDFPKGAPASWPQEFAWLMDALMVTLRQVSLTSNGSLPDSAYAALQQLCFFKDPRVVPFVLDWQKNHPTAGSIDWVVASCLRVQNPLLISP